MATVDLPQTDLAVDVYKATPHRVVVEYSNDPNSERHKINLYDDDNGRELRTDENAFLCTIVAHKDYYEIVGARSRGRPTMIRISTGETIKVPASDRHVIVEDVSLPGATRKRKRCEIEVAARVIDSKVFLESRVRTVERVAFAVADVMVIGRSVFRATATPQIAFKQIAKLDRDLDPVWDPIQTSPEGDLILYSKGSEFRINIA